MVTVANVYDICIRCIKIRIPFKLQAVLRFLFNKMGFMLGLAAWILGIIRHIVEYRIYLFCLTSLFGCPLGNSDAPTFLLVNGQWIHYTWRKSYKSNPPNSSINKFEKKSGWMDIQKVFTSHTSIRWKNCVFNCEYTWCDFYCQLSIHLVPQIHFVSFKIMERRRRKMTTITAKAQCIPRAHKKGEFHCPSRNLYHCAVDCQLFFYLQ